jgi:hypothetical protein
MAMGVRGCSAEPGPVCVFEVQWRLSPETATFPHCSKLNAASAPKRVTAQAVSSVAFIVIFKFNLG